MIVAEVGLNHQGRNAYSFKYLEQLNLTDIDVSNPNLNQWHNWYYPAITSSYVEYSSGAFVPGSGWQGAMT